MPTFVMDGETFEVNGHRIEGVACVISRYQGFKCLECGEEFKTDPDDHECDDLSLGRCGAPSCEECA